MTALSRQREDGPLGIRASGDPSVARHFNWTVEDLAPASLYAPYRQVDIADEVALKDSLADVLPQTQRIVHLAAQAGVRYSIEQPEEYVRANLNGHFNMLQVARMAPKLEHLVYASSSSVYGASKKVPFSLDDAADHPVSLYAHKKAEAKS